MENHVKAVGILWIAKGVLGVLAGFLVLSILLGIGIFAGVASGDDVVLPVMAIVGVGLGILVLFGLTPVGWMVIVLLLHGLFVGLAWEHIITPDDFQLGSRIE